MDLAELVAQQNQLQNPRSRRPARRRERRLRASGTAVSDLSRTTKQLRAIARAAQDLVARELFALLKRRESEYLLDSMRVVDDFADELNTVLTRIRSEFEPVATFRAKSVSADLTRRTNLRNRKKFYEAVESVVGIDLSAVVSEGNLESVLKMKTRENVNLISSISEDYFDQVERMVYENVVQGRKSAKSMIVELRELGVKTDKRARFIARDQTSKLNAAINRERNQALGITEYIWRTSKDERVRPTHRSKDGKKFLWDSPPADTGNPGEDFQCRCNAEPVIVI